MVAPNAMEGLAMATDDIAPYFRERISTLIRRMNMVAVKKVAGKCLACAVVFGSFALLAWTLPVLAWVAFKS